MWNSAQNETGRTHGTRVQLASVFVDDTSCLSVSPNTHFVVSSNDILTMSSGHRGKNSQHAARGREARDVRTRNI